MYVCICIYRCTFVLVIVSPNLDHVYNVYIHHHKLFVLVSHSIVSLIEKEKKNKALLFLLIYMLS